MKAENEKQRRCYSCKYFTMGEFRHQHTGEGYYIEEPTPLQEKEFGMCLHEKISSDFVDGWMKRKVTESSDGIYASCDEYRGDLKVGRNFGCIHWEEL